MAQTPKSVKVKVELDKEALEIAEGLGRQKGRQEILTWLEEKYLGENRPDRGTPEAKALLELTREAAEFLRSLK